jgi:hypothetical protein
MKSIYTLSAYTLISLFCLITVFHALVLLQIIPFTIVWGGRLKTESDMYVFESISLIINICMLVVVLSKKEIIHLNIPPKMITVALWLMCLLFFINTLGNLNAIDPFEKIVFTPITLLLSLTSLILAVEKKAKQPS